MSHQTLHITEQQKQQFQEEGYVVLEDVVPPKDLQLLRDVCDEMVAETDDLIDSGQWQELSGITHKGLGRCADNTWRALCYLGTSSRLAYLPARCPQERLYGRTDRRDVVAVAMVLAQSISTPAGLGGTGQVGCLGWCARAAFDAKLRPGVPGDRGGRGRVLWLLGR